MAWPFYMPTPPTDADSDVPEDLSDGQDTSKVVPAKSRVQRHKSLPQKKANAVAAAATVMMTASGKAAT